MAASHPPNLGRYVIEGELGRGAMGVVYRARDPRIDRPVALKTLSPHVHASENAAVLKERFLNEGRAAGRLSHRGIVAVYDADEDAATGTAFLAMEFVEGTDLRQLMKAGEPLSRLIDILGQVADALDHAHARGVIHRDIKPANVLIDSEGQPHLTDFGIARLGDSTLTQDGEFLGTPAYMAPEQVRARPVSPQTDVYALGVILYECLTGRRPFEGDSMVATATAIATDVAPPPSAVAPVPAAFDAVVARALAKDPAARHASAGELAADMRRALRLSGDLTSDRTAVSPTPSAGTMSTVAVPPASPRRTLLAAAAIVVALAGAGLGYLALRGGADDAEAGATAPRGGKPAAGKPTASTAAAAKPVVRPTPRGSLIVEITSPREGTLVIRDGDRQIGRLAVEGKRKGVGMQVAASGTYPVTAGTRTLGFTFSPADGKVLTEQLECLVTEGQSTHVVLDVGTLGRALDAKLK